MTFRRVQKPKAPFGLCEFIEDHARCARPAKWELGGDIRLCWRHVRLTRRETRLAPPDYRPLEEVKLRAGSSR